MPTVPEGREVVVTVNAPGALMVMVSDPLVAVPNTASVTLTVKVEVPAVGVLPEITPVLAFKMAQAGRLLPEAIDQV